MAGAQTQQPGGARHIWRAQGGEAQHAKGRDGRGAEEEQAMNVRGRGLDFVPKAAGRRRRVSTQAGQPCPGLQHDPIRPGLPAHQALPLPRCWSIHSFIHAVLWPSTYRVPNVMQGPGDAHQVPDFKSSPSEDGGTQREAYVTFQCDADRL